MHQPTLAAVEGDGQAPLGLPIGDLRGFGRVRADAALDRLSLDRADGWLRSSHPERALLSLQMDGEAVSWESAYVPGTNVLETVGHADGVELRVADFMAVAEGRPGQPEAVPAGRFVRIVSCTEGEASFRLVCAATLADAGKTEGRTNDGWYLACSRPMGTAADVAATHVRLKAGESVAFVISASRVQGGATLAAEALHALGDTIHYWTWWSDRCRYKGDDVESRLRDALDLKLGCDHIGLIVEGPRSAGFVRAPLGEASRAAHTFLMLGYRSECATLLNVIHGLQAAITGRWPADDRFIQTLHAYVLRYGTQGLSDPLRDAVNSAPVTLAQAL